MPLFLWGINSDSLWNYIYCPPYLSLVAVVDKREMVDFGFNENFPQKTFGNFVFALVQNNVAVTGGQLAPEISEKELLIKAHNWAMIEGYLK